MSEPDTGPYSLTYQEFYDLEVYLAEIKRGILHSADWIAKMTDVAARKDAYLKRSQG